MGSWFSSKQTKVSDIVVGGRNPPWKATNIHPLHPEIMAVAAKFSERHETEAGSYSKNCKDARKDP